MASLQDRIKAFSTLGKFLQQFSKENFKMQKGVPYNDLFFDSFTLQIKKSSESNPWFTIENICKALRYWGEHLNEENLKKWLSRYTISDANSSKKVAVIMAGNIPLVGFHDFLCVLLCGYSAQVKMSSHDRYLLPFIGKYLTYVCESFKEKIFFTEGKLACFDAVIATGSNNTSRYFEAYFGKYPHIIRKTRNTVAIVTKKETLEDLQKMSKDIFSFFGLGCRSVSKIFIPKNYDLELIFKAAESYRYLLRYQKYKNNYDYNKAVYLMNLFTFKDNGFFILKENKKYASPIASIFYEYYESLEMLKEKFQKDTDKIQCITSNLNWEKHIPLGQTQSPKLWQYADEKDTIDFLIHF